VRDPKYVRASFFRLSHIDALSLLPAYLLLTKTSSHDFHQSTTLIITTSFIFLLIKFKYLEGKNRQSAHFHSTHNPIALYTSPKTGYSTAAAKLHKEAQ
jgi:hypothetical protein